MPAWADNLIYNGGFEAGLDYRIAVDRWFIAGPESASLDGEDAAEGRQSLRIPFSRRAGTPGTDAIDGIALRATTPVTLDAGRRYRFAAQLRASGRFKGRISLLESPLSAARAEVLARRDIVVGTDWSTQAVQLASNRAGPAFWQIEVDADESGELWIDDLRLTGIDGASSGPDTAPAITIAAARPGHIFETGEAPTLQLGIHRPAGANEQAQVTALTVDISGTEVSRQKIPIAATLISDAVPVSLPALPNGVYRTSVQLEGEAAANSEVTFTILPLPRSVPAADAAFGAYLTLSPPALDIMARAGFRWIGNLTSNSRLIYWRQVEPQPGTFVWHDSDVELALSRGFELMFNVDPCRRPKWTDSLTRPELLERWKIYVTAMAEHYGDRVGVWTIGDEAHNATNPGSYKRVCWTTPREYAEWHAAGVDAIKGVRPRARVIMNTWDDFAAQTFEYYPAASVDILGMNAYHNPKALRRMAELARRTGIGELWAPGVGSGGDPFYAALIPRPRRAELPSDHWRIRSRALAKHVVETFGLGYRRLIHYTATYVGNTNRFSLFEADSGLKPTGAQFATLAWLLDGFTASRELRLPGLEPPARVFRFDRRDGQTVFALWSRSSPAQDVTLPARSELPLTAFDSFANPLKLEQQGTRIQFSMKEDPIFLVVPRDAAKELEEALAGLSIALRALPAAGRVEIAGRYALLQDVEDLYYRRPPNLSLWYRTDQGAWIEVFRNRTSAVQPAWELTSEGAQLSWNFERPAPALALSPGMFPPTLLDDARYEVLSGDQVARAGEIRIDDGRILESRDRATAYAGHRTATPAATIFRLQLPTGPWIEAETLKLDGAPAPDFGALQLRVWEGREAYLHYGYPAGRASPLRLEIRLSVSEPGA